VAGRKEIVVFFDSLGLVPDTSPGCAKKAILTTSSEIVESLFLRIT
jgi:hypothetical protein